MKENRLVIIGNGFDVCHGIKTGYMDFKRYMLNNKSDDLTNTFISTEEYFCSDTKESINVLFNIIDKACVLTDNGKHNSEEWNVFEEALGNVDYKDIAGSYSELSKNKGDVSLIILHIFRWLEAYFKEWISEINYEKAIKRFPFNKNDLFLTFNYTRTLEYLYRIKNSNICHIHGTVDFKNINTHEDYFVFGHNKEIKDIDYCNNDNFKKIANLLRKNNSIYKDRYGAFLNVVKEANITKIYDFGFSFSEVDESYIKELISVIDNKKIIWFSNIHVEGGEDRIKLLKRLGFDGKIVITDNNNKSDILL